MVILYGVTFFFEWEVLLIEFIQSHMGQLGILVSTIFTYIGAEIVLVPLIGFFYWGYNKKLGKLLVINLTVIMSLNCLIKNVVLRRRPYFDNASIKCLSKVSDSADMYDIGAQGYSFPSGHAMCTSGFFLTLSLYFRKKALYIVSFFIVLFVGVSRFALGVHYPTDVFCGWILGILVSLLILFLYRRVENHNVMFLIFLVVASLGWVYCSSDDYYTVYGIMFGAFFAFMFEERIVNFESTRSILRCILRTLCGALIFLLIDTVLKIPFSQELLQSGSLLAHVIRSSRYAVATFISLGVYPLIFNKTKKLFKKI